MALVVLRGAVPPEISGDGAGDGYGDGYGDGSGSGDGYGYGSGAGDGYGYGYGSGDGSGSGYGYGDGYGDGYGSGAGDGYGYGYGSGYGDDVIACSPDPQTITVADLKRVDACADQVRAFVRAFPAGAEFPGDIEKAAAAGLNVEWAGKSLGLLLPKATP